MHSGVHLGLEEKDQLFCKITVHYFLYFYSKTVFITANKIFFQQLAFITLIL